ncbi:MAG: hypothetical protein KIT16_18410 [Rhodospirillaceae bacterium]|nr:hypothetical protein [Rhodospirillaceae bacterium]
MLRRLAVPAALLLIAAGAPASAQEYFGLGHIQREGTPTAAGPDGPPWKRVQVQASFVGVPAKTALSGPATILPHDPALPPATLPIRTMAPYQREECTGQISKYRRAEFPDLAGAAYRDYAATDKVRGPAFVGSVLVVYPAVPKARALPKQSVAAGDMPQNFPLSTLEAAFDLAGSGRAEIVQVRYCCYDAAFDEAQCIKAGGKNGGARCLAIYRKDKAGWRRVFFDHDQDC